MNHNHQSDKYECGHMSRWAQPAKHDESQRYLFGMPTNELLANLKVSHDDALRWQSQGWLSFDVGQVEELERPLEWELRFIASIARSGLYDAQVTELLASLEKPYRYDPDLIAFSFQHGWVSPPRERDAFDVIEESVDDWLESLAEDGQLQRLQLLREHLSRLVDELDLTGD